MKRGSGDPEAKGPGSHGLSALPPPCWSAAPWKVTTTRLMKADSHDRQPLHHITGRPLATDGSSASDGALRYAVEQARARRAGLRILHVMPMAVPMPPLRPVEPADLEPYARKVLSARSTRHARDLAPGLAVSTSWLTAAASAASSTARPTPSWSWSVARPATVSGRLLTGATTAGVASNATCPVVVVPGALAAAEQRRGRRHGRGRASAGRDDASHLMAAAYAQASSLGASITVVHAWELPDPYIDSLEGKCPFNDDWQALGEQLLSEALGTWRDQHPHLPVETRVVHGHAASVLVSEAKAADLVVVRRAHEHRPWTTSGPRSAHCCWPARHRSRSFTAPDTGGVAS